MDEERYLGLLAKLIGEAEHLQNNPAQVRVAWRAWVCCGVSGGQVATRIAIPNAWNIFSYQKMQGLVPEENKASDHVMAALAPHSKEQGGPLLVRLLGFGFGVCGVRWGWVYKLLILKACRRCWWVGLMLWVDVCAHVKS